MPCPRTQQANLPARSVPLSNNAVSRRINEISDNIEAQVCIKLQETEFSIQLDESTVHDNQALLLAYVRFINNKKFVKRRCFVIHWKHFAKEKTFFSNLKSYLNLKGIPI